MKTIYPETGFLLFLLFVSVSAGAQSLNKYLSKPDNWYGSPEAIRLANNVLLFQRNAGGWHKGENYFKDYSKAAQQHISDQKRRRDCTFDNNATYTELRFLAKVYSATKDKRYKDAFNLGIDLIFDAQYANGGWPQYYPESHKIWSSTNSRWNPGGLEHFITYNDGAMIGIIRLLKDVSEQHIPFTFIDRYRQQKADTAVKRGIQCILKSQFYYDGRMTGWPAQVNEVTFAPEWGRNFEPPSISSRASASIIRFLMNIGHPDQKTIAAIQAGIKWLDEVKILHIKIMYGDTMTVFDDYTHVSHSGRRDAWVQKDMDAPPIWARFYELNTFRPVFCSKDDTVRYRLADISLERRSGYDWYGYWPAKLLSVKYPAWCNKQKVVNTLAQTDTKAF